MTVKKDKIKQNDNHYVAKIYGKKGARLGSKSFLQEQLSKLSISIVGLNLTDKDAMYVGSQIRNMVGATIEGNKSKLQRAEDKIRILLEKRLDLSREDRKEIETRIKQLVQRIHPVNDESLGTTKGGVTRYHKNGGPYGVYQPLSRSCIRIGILPGMCIPIVDWRLIKAPALSAARPHRFPRGSTTAITPSQQLPQNYALLLMEDRIVMTVADGASIRLPPTSMRVTLTSSPSVTWQKGIVGWHLTLGPTPNRTIITRDNNHGPVSMTITQADCTSGEDTIILEKAKLFGDPTRMYHFDSNFFWPILGGKIVTIDWLEDSVFPPNLGPLTCPQCKGCP